MIIWLNGTFGAGKTTTSKELAPLIAGARIFDAEFVGYMLRDGVTDMPPTAAGGFQSWQPWRSLVVETATRLLDFLGGPLIVVQTVLEKPYWDEIRAGFEEAAVPVHHFVLHTDRGTLTERIEGHIEASRARGWRLKHLPDYERAQAAWLHREAQVIDTTGITPARVAELIRARLEILTAGQSD